MSFDRTTQPLDLHAVKIRDSFWGAYQDRVINHMIPYQWEALNDRIPNAEKSHCIHNFRVAAGVEKGEFGGCVFQDSDFSKWIEAVAYALTVKPDPALESIADEAIDLVVSAQQPDGYLDTYYIINGMEKRFTNLKDHHELYCFGHMLEGAIAYYESTGKDKLLQALIRFADCIDSHIGPEEGKLKGYPGHEVAEMALMRLYAVTGDEKHLKLAKYFVDQRGQAPLYFEEETLKYGNRPSWNDSPFRYQYYQAGKPVREQETADGHAVRATYLYSGMADVARVTEDEELYRVTRRLWENIAARRMYITGGIGSSAYGESFTFDYDLPNDTVYAETCATIGLIFFAHRMLRLAPKSEYADVMERALYNGVISGMSLDGTSFFYVNPLEVIPQASREDHLREHVKPTRQKWFGCACCPPNVARLVTSLGRYAYTQSDDTLYAHLYVGSELQAELGGKPFAAKVETGLPWKGDARLTVTQGCEGALALRIPAWCQGQYALTLNGRPVAPEMRDGYAVLRRDWQAGDTLAIGFDMAVKVMAANPHVRDNIGKVAVTRGPIVFCLEEADNGAELHRLRLPHGAAFTETFRDDLLDGVMVLAAQGETLAADWDDSTLYGDASGEGYAPKQLTFIPYYAWANRAEGEMLVWVHQG